MSAISLLLLLVVGCGPGNPLGRQAVSGKATLDGEPLDHGAISFSPESAAGVNSGTVIKSGFYAIPAAQGLPPGKYLVRINSTAPNPADAGRPIDPSVMGSGLPGTERIAPTYNSQSRIVIEVVAGQQARFDFNAHSPRKNKAESPAGSKQGN